MSDRVPTRDGDGFSWSSALGTVLTMTGLQVALLGPSRWSDFAPGLLFNATFVLVCWSVFEPLVSRLPRGRWFGVLYYPLLAASCGLVFAHTWYFDVAIERRLTLLDLSWSGLRYFFEVALPARGWVGLAMSYAALVGLALVAKRLGRARVVRTVLRAMAGALLVACGVFVVSGARVPSPLFDTTQELWELAVRPKVGAATRRPALRSLAQLDKSQATWPDGQLRYHKVIVLVMETMTAEKLARESAALPAHGFLRRERAHTQRYERYFPNNQDSRTGMLDMLFERLIPYEAYSEQGYAGYRGLVDAPSLVERFEARGFATAFAVSQTTLEDVVGELPWTQTLHLRERDIAAAREAKQLCFTPDEWEQSCEDLVLLPSVLDFVARHERAFVYQEFIWGHASEYNEASGKSNAAYYEAYVDALLDGLAARGLKNDTLIALTSDHGFRDKGRQDDPEMYRVPLLFYGAGLPARSDDALFSHTDFGALLAERLLVDAPRATGNDLAMIVGPTGQGHLFVVEPAGYMLVRHKAGLDLLITEQGTLRHSPAESLALFRAYRSRFAAQMTNKSATH